MMQVVLKRGREKWILEGHSWVFRAAVQSWPDAEPGAIVDVVDRGNRFVARGYYNPHSSIPVRILTCDKDEEIGSDWLRDRIAKAVVLRQFDEKVTNAYRLVHSENDFLPGLIVDRYSDFLVVQFHTLGLDQYRNEVVETLVQEVAPRGIYERSDVGARQGEGLETLPTGVLYGTEPPDQVIICENGAEFVCDIKGGQKTGFFLDQRENRLAVQGLCQGAEVLNCFSYSGGFSVFAARGGAVLTESIDASEPALALARENLKRNGLDSESHYCIRAQVFDYLKACREEGRLFDVVIVDPPAFAKSRGALKRAQRAYVRLNKMAIEVLKPGGILVSASCSSAVDYELFWGLLKKAGGEISRQIQVVKSHLQSADHPGYIAFPEGRYLKCFFCRVL